MINVEQFLVQYNNELWGTFIALFIFGFLRFLSIKTVRRIGKISDINQMRTRLVIRYVSFGLFIVLVVALILIWGVNFKEVGIVISSAFAVLGVALFANWSILSNVTAGIILFFYFPYKIGDRIRIQDKDFPEEAVILDIQAFNLILIKEDTGELLTYPNNLILQKGVLLIQKQVATDEDLEQHL